MTPESDARHHVGNDTFGREIPVRGCPAMHPMPWLADFERDPFVALDELLRGVADIAPYERAEASDVLVKFFAGLSEEHADRRRLDEALTSWLRTRRDDGPEARRRHGARRYVDEVTQALTAVYRLRLRGTARWLRDEFAALQLWLTSLDEGPSEDPAGELWRVMALMQEDRRFLGDWYRLCEAAGRSLPGHYLSLGLLGLRFLPADDGQGASKPEPSGLVPARS